MTEHEKLIFDDKLIMGSLKNGLTYYIYNDVFPKNNAKLALTVKAGSLMDEEHQRGMAHFTEHICIFNDLSFPDKRNNIKSIFRDISARGYTKLEETVFILDSAPEDINKCLEFFRGIIVGNTFTKENFEKIRNEVIKELISQKDKLSFKLRQAVLPVIMNDSKFADKLPIGELKHIEGFTYDSVMFFHKKWYRPENIAISIVGDISKHNTKVLIDNYFSEIEKDNISSETFQLKRPLKKEQLLINTFEDISGYEAQIYYLKSPSKYELVSELEKRIIVQFQLWIIQQHLQNYFILNGLDYDKMKCLSERFILDFEFYILEFKTKEKFLYKLEAMFKIIKEFILIGLQMSEFEAYRRTFLENFRVSYNETQGVSADIIIKECINNFLYNEPLIPLSYEYDICFAAIQNLRLEEVNIGIRELLTNPRITLVINAESGFEVNKERIINFLNSLVSN